jgi:hypothetical protein
MTCASIWMKCFIVLPLGLKNSVRMPHFSSDCNTQLRTLTEKVGSTRRTASGLLPQFQHFLPRPCRELYDSSDYSTKADAHSLRSLRDKELNHAQS